MRRDLAYRFVITRRVMRDEYARRAAVALARSHAARLIPYEQQHVRFDRDDWPDITRGAADYIIEIRSHSTHRRSDRISDRTSDRVPRYRT